MAKNKRRQGMFGGDDFQYPDQWSYRANNNGHQHPSKKGWDTGDAPVVCTNCDWLPKERTQTIVMEHAVWKVLMALCHSVKVEWQVLLSGSVDTDGVVRITGYYIPKQEVGPASVKNLDAIDDVFIATHNIVAGVHSHADMQCFFSTTDHDDTNMSLIKHNIVVNNKGEYKATSRIELPCGLVKFIDGVMTIENTPTVEIAGFDNITTINTIAYRKPTWYESNNKKDEQRYDGIIDGIRFCTTCSLIPEEDNGPSCVCWTKAKRHMLPDFTQEHYTLVYGKTWRIKEELLKKYQSM